MTHIKKSCLLIIGVLMICTWVAPLQAAQNKESHGQSTDGTFFILNQVLSGGGTAIDDEGDITPFGTLGQVVSHVGTSSADGITQSVGFWPSVQPTESALLSFNSSETFLATESNADLITLTLALNKSLDTPLTITVGINLSSKCDNLDYTLFNKTESVESASSVTVVVDAGKKVNTDLTVQIINDGKIEETIETLNFFIKDIEGDAKPGIFDEYSINILANDNLSLTGSVCYLGSQTGTLNIVAIDKDTGEPLEDVDPDTFEWDTDKTRQDFVTKLPPGDYTIVAYIDSAIGAGALTGVMNSWEVQGAYSLVVSIEEDTDYPTNIAFSMNDPDDRYSAQYIEYTGTYKEWIANYPTLGGPDDDDDQDGYSNFQEYINGTNPLNPNQAYMFNGYDPASDIDAAQVETIYQIVSTNPIDPKVRMGESFRFDVNYTNSDNNRGTTGLGIAIHFNSSFMTFAGFSNVLTETLAGSLENLTIAVKDESDPDTPDDNFADTDKVITLAWVSDLQGRSWPGLEVPLPLRLCTLQFAVVSEAQGITYGDTSVLRFSATSVDSRYEFYGSPTTLEVSDFSFDVDGNGKAGALTDGLLIMRYLFGLIVNSPTTQADAIADDAIRTSSAEIWTYLNNGYEMLDIDGDGTKDALTDGLLIMRYMFGLTEGDSLIENAISAEAPRKTDTEVEKFIKQYLPKKGSVVITPTLN